MMIEYIQGCEDQCTPRETRIRHDLKLNLLSDLSVVKLRRLWKRFSITVSLSLCVCHFGFLLPLCVPLSLSLSLFLSEHVYIGMQSIHLRVSVLRVTTPIFGVTECEPHPPRHVPPRRLERCPTVQGSCLEDQRFGPPKAWRKLWLFTTCFNLELIVAKGLQLDCENNSSEIMLERDDS